ncbi:MAG: VTT domain-containing protein [Pyrobaculum sp.]
MESLEGFALLGPLGVFLAVFISHLIPFVPLPGYLATITYVGYYKDPPAVVAAILATGLGAALGKVVVYMYGYGIGKVVLKEELEYAKKLFAKISKWGVDLAVFIFAISPLADDVLYIPLGAAGYSFKRFFLSVLIGKMVLATVIVVLTDVGVSIVEEYVGDPIFTIFVLAGLTVAITLAVLRVKWSMVLKAYEEKGAVEAAKTLLMSIFRRA